MIKVLAKLPLHKLLEAGHIAELNDGVLLITEEDGFYDSEVIIAPPPFFTKDNLLRYKSLKWIQLTTAGYNGMDFAYLREHGIRLTNAKGVYAGAIAEDVMSKIMWFNRDLDYYRKQKENKVWKLRRYNSELEGSTVAIIGAGNIGQTIARRLKAFDLTTTGYRRQNRKTPYFDRIYNTEDGLRLMLREADYVISVLPSSDTTKSVLGREQFALMKPDALFINVGRGDTIDEAALTDMLKNNRIRGAALDVTETEPLPADSPLWELGNVFITPHNSGLTPSMYPKLLNLILFNLRAYLDGKPLKNIVKTR